MCLGWSPQRLLLKRASFISCMGIWTQAAGYKHCCPLVFTSNKYFTLTFVRQKTALKVRGKQARHRQTQLEMHFPASKTSQFNVTVICWHCSKVNKFTCCSRNSVSLWFFSSLFLSRVIVLLNAVGRIYGGQKCLHLFQSATHFYICE